MGKIVQINVSLGGVPKKPVESAELGLLGIQGDVQRDKRYHGGPTRAVLLIASEMIDLLRNEGWPLYYGALGENLTTAGLDHRAWRTGQRFQAGSAVLELTKPRAPCGKLDVYGPGIQKRIYDALVKKLDASSSHWGECGFYAAVIRDGTVRRDDIIEALDQVV